jgi:hypothetical protein
MMVIPLITECFIIVPTAASLQNNQCAVLAGLALYRRASVGFQQVYSRQHP